MGRPVVLIPGTVVPGIRAGEVTLAFRSWKRPTVKAGGTLLTQAGQLAIDAVEIVDPTSITDADARRSGASTADEVRQSLRVEDGRRTYRIDFHLAGEDPRIALRESAELTDAERAAIRQKLDGFDGRSPTGPWTTATLELIGERPAVVSTELADALGDERPRLKLRIRKLKALGLTESLEVGYRLSPRGSAYLERERPTRG